ncbi:hypothetical protein AB9K26_04370 [Psychroserpens sp. XS_ASV72]|uniref:hypothetical protein n=1 Tax=Psychroserpens sp. XS_ASV72 TaxID=3241293 RepID=UPI0035165DE4
MKSLYITLSFVLISIFSYCQQLAFQKNINYKAQFLQQSINAQKDSLILKSTGDKILQVDIFNDKYSKSVDVNSNVSKINLTSIPKGKYVVQARVDGKWIVMYMDKREDHKITPLTGKEITTNNTIATPKQNRMNSAKTQTPTYFWVVSESNSNFGSNKSMRLEHKDDIAKLISKHKLEKKSKIGENNTLAIYEVYNTSEFMDKQMKNPDYYKYAENSSSFNEEPLFATNTRPLKSSVAVNSERSVAINEESNSDFGL